MPFLKAITIILSLVVTGLGLTSQVRKNYLRKSTEGLSFFYFFILAISYSFWSMYGFLQKDIVLIIPMSAGMIVSWIVVTQFLTYRKK
ncbi:MAG: SemiSWEET family transporter [Patescibacteria group bacterium]